MYTIRKHNQIVKHNSLFQFIIVHHETISVALIIDFVFSTILHKAFQVKLRQNEEFIITEFSTKSVS